MIAGILSYLVRVEKQTDHSKDSAWESIFQTTWTSILPRENWVSGKPPNIWGHTVFKWTHQLQNEADNQERSLYCAGCGYYPRLSGGGSDLIQKVPMMGKLPRRLNIVEHQ